MGRLSVILLLLGWVSAKAINDDLYLMTQQKIETKSQVDAKQQMQLEQFLSMSNK